MRWRVAGGSNEGLDCCNSFCAPDHSPVIRAQNGLKSGPMLACCAGIEAVPAHLSDCLGCLSPCHAQTPVIFRQVAKIELERAGQGFSIRLGFLPPKSNLIGLLWKSRNGTDLAFRAGVGNPAVSKRPVWWPARELFYQEMPLFIQKRENENRNKSHPDLRHYLV